MSWISTVSSLCRIGRSGSVRLQSTQNGNELSFVTADPTGRFRIRLDTAYSKGLSPVTIPYRALTTIPDDTRVDDISINDRAVTTRSDTAVVTVQVSRDGVPSVQDPEPERWEPVPDELKSVLSLARVMERDKDQIPFRAVVVSNQGSVTGLATGAAIIRGAGIGSLTDGLVLRIPGDARAWLEDVVKSSESIAVSEERIWFRGRRDEIRFVAEIAMSREPSPLERFLPEMVWQPFQAKLPGPIIVPKMDLMRAVSSVSGISGPVSLTGGDSHISVTTRNETTEMVEIVAIETSVDTSAVVNHLDLVLSRIDADENGLIQLYVGEHVMVQGASVSALLLGVRL